MSAVSKKLIPASSAASITLTVSFSSIRQPKFMQPRPMTETSSEPIFRVSICVPAHVTGRHGITDPSHNKSRSLGDAAAAVLEFFAAATWARLVAPYLWHLAADRRQLQLYVLTVISRLAIAARAPTDSLGTSPGNWPR